MHKHTPHKLPHTPFLTFNKKKEKKNYSLAVAYAVFKEMNTVLLKYVQKKRANI